MQEFIALGFLTVSLHKTETKRLSSIPQLSQSRGSSVPQNKKGYVFHMKICTVTTLWSRKMVPDIHPGRLTWNTIMKVWKMIFLFNWMIFMFHVNLPGCIRSWWSFPKSTTTTIATIATLWFLFTSSGMGRRAMVNLVWKDLIFVKITCHCMGVSKNRGTPKWMVCNGKPY